MKPETFKKYIEKEKKEIEDAKWFEGIKIGRDPGEEFTAKWIEKYAKVFRKKFAKEELKEAISEFEDFMKRFGDYYFDATKLKKKLGEIQEKVKAVKEFLENNNEVQNGKD